MKPDSTATQAPAPRRFVSITRTVHPSSGGYILDAVASDGTAWYCVFSPYCSFGDLGWKQHGALPPIS